MPRPLRLGDGRSPLSHQRSLPVLCSPGHLGKPGTRPCPPWSAAPRHKLESGTRGDSLGRRVGLARAQQVPVLFSRSAPDDHSPAVKWTPLSVVWAPVPLLPKPVSSLPACFGLGNYVSPPPHRPPFASLFYFTLRVSYALSPPWLLADIIGSCRPTL